MIACVTCGQECDLVEHIGDGTIMHVDTPSLWPGKGKRGYRALYFNYETDVDFCGPACSTKWMEERRHG